MSGRNNNAQIDGEEELIDLIYTTDLEKFDPPVGLYLGEKVPAVEVPLRTQNMMGALMDSGLVRLVAPKSYGEEKIAAVHDEELIAFIREVNSTRIVDAEFAVTTAPSVAYPFTFPYSTGISKQHSSSIIAKMGRFVFDLATPINADTYPAAYKSVECALTGADILFHDNKRIAFALCRPPGHHAMRAMAGGYSYFNNAAIAAAHLLELTNKKLAAEKRPRSRTNSKNSTSESSEEKDSDHLKRLGTEPRVAILDVDFHHGNGTQEIFYDTDAVLYVSLHCTPDKAYPYFSGFADERGNGRGEGFNINLPLPTNTSEADYTQALDKALSAIKSYAPNYLIISLGFDTFVGDPISSFQLGEDYFTTMAARIAKLGLPTLLVAEGGYALDKLGLLAVNFLKGWKSVLIN